MKKNLFNVFLVCVFCVAAIPDMFAQQIKVTGKVTFYWLCDPASAGRWKKSIECSVER